MRTSHRSVRRPVVAALSSLLLLWVIALSSSAAQFPIATTTGTELAYTVASDGTNYLAAILDGNKITAQLVSPTGSLVGSRIQTGRTGDVPGGLPIVAYGGNTYLMVWQDNASATDLPYGQLISRSGTLSGSTFPVSSHG
jgi:hypothetical protein